MQNSSLFVVQNSWFLISNREFIAFRVYQARSAWTILDILTCRCVVKIIDSSFKMMDLAVKMMDFAFNIMNLVVKMLDFSFKMMDSAFRMLNFAFKLLNFSLKLMDVTADPPYVAYSWSILPVNGCWAVRWNCWHRYDTMMASISNYSRGIYIHNNAPQFPADFLSKLCVYICPCS